MRLQKRMHLSELGNCSLCRRERHASCRSARGALGAGLVSSSRRLPSRGGSGVVGTSLVPEGVCGARAGSMRSEQSDCRRISPSDTPPWRSVALLRARIGRWQADANANIRRDLPNRKHMSEMDLGCELRSPLVRYRSRHPQMLQLLSRDMSSPAERLNFVNAGCCRLARCKRAPTSRVCPVEVALGTWWVIRGAPRFSV